MNGGAIRATLIGFKLNNTNKMPNPTLVMRKTLASVVDNRIWHEFLSYAPEIVAELSGKWSLVIRIFIYVEVKTRGCFAERVAISTACSNSWARTSLV